MIATITISPNIKYPVSRVVVVKQQATTEKNMMNIKFYNMSEQVSVKHDGKNLGFRLDRDTTLLDPYLFNDLKYQFIFPIETKIQ
jgi:hypothetical protein